MLLDIYNIESIPLKPHLKHIYGSNVMPNCPQISSFKITKSGETFNISSLPSQKRNPISCRRVEGQARYALV